MRRLAATIDTSTSPHVHRVVNLDQLVAEWRPDLRFLVMAHSDESRNQVCRLQATGITNVSWVTCDSLELGDIVVPDPSKNHAFVLYRESDAHHALLLTNRCNSYCLMCSQPPTKHDDSWLIDEALDVINHLKNSPSVLGLTGGEPLLLGASLQRILDALATQHPTTRVEVLTNGRLFSDPVVAAAVLGSVQANVRWLVPLYGHADFLHDFVVQAHGAYEQTLAGLLTLQEHGQQVQLRIVLIDPVLRVLDELCGFIGRNLPFVREVALMACEPIGFALANREHCEVDLADWTDGLKRASKTLDRHAVPHLFMNAPLCALPETLWHVAHKSISDWKNSYAAECDRCTVKEQCSGLFAWHERGWKPTKIRAIEWAVM
jgi:His-Xaa-Ser system radical SAM maturase HxsC